MLLTYVCEGYSTLCIHTNNRFLGYRPIITAMLSIRDSSEGCKSNSSCFTCGRIYGFLRNGILAIYISGFGDIQDSAKRDSAEYGISKRSTGSVC